MRKKITHTELTQFIIFIRQLTGIVLTEKKAYLFEDRLEPLLNKYQMEAYKSLYELAVQDASGVVVDDITSAMVTDETYFFRDNLPFEMLANRILPEHFFGVDAYRSGGRYDLKVWSAACSRGQEIYTIAMILKELLGDFSDYQLNLLGTDISPSALSYAAAGLYSKFELSRGISFKRLMRHFDCNENGCQVKRDLHDIVRFERINLHESLADYRGFDIILCRNVAVYFSMEDRKKLFNKMADCLSDNGILIIGSTENLLGLTKRYQRRELDGAVYYVKRP